MTYITPLPVSALREAGIPEPWSFGRADRVRFHELDALNHVNNAAYLSWFEALRVLYMVEYGLAYDRPDAPLVVLKRVTCDYHRPLFLNDDYIVTARCAAFRRTSLTKAYAVWSAGRLVAEGSAVIVLTAPDGATKVPIPETVRQTFVDGDGATPE